MKHGVLLRGNDRDVTSTRQTWRQVNMLFLGYDARTAVNNGRQIFLNKPQTTPWHISYRNTVFLVI